MKIVVVGGVAAGASAAARARRLSESCEITILESDHYVSFANCGLPYHIGGEIENRDSLLLQTPESLKASLDIDVRIGHEVTSIDRERKEVNVVNVDTNESYSQAYDKLVLCPGATAIRPPLPGIDLPSVYVLRNIPDMDVIKAAVDGGARRAVVIGGGYIGVEVAEAFRNRDMTVDLVEMVDQIMPPLDHEMARDLQYHMQSHGVSLHLGVAAKAFIQQTDHIEVQLQNGESIAADLVVCAAGVRPNVTLAQQAGLAMGSTGGIKVDGHMRTSDPDIYAAGDAVEVTDTVTGLPALIPLAGPANRQGRVVADHIFGRPGVYHSTQGTAIVKVFDMTGGSTGASEKNLRRAEMPFAKVYVHPSGHAGYYPGSSPLHIKLLFEPEDGVVLGAQVVGYDGVDKRLDVFSTAIRSRLTVFDLEHLELAYAPPYGSAKDPVNMAGFVAANLLRKDVEFWYAEDYPSIVDSGAIVDVRSKTEFDVWHIPEAINIPLQELRDRMDELPVEQPLYLYCRVGFRSYLAYRLLKQRGRRRVQTLAGGSKTFTTFHLTTLETGRPGAPFMAHAEEEMAILYGTLDHA
jgi:NADPH-dependent 2,4-dienoyl-CoA reductase/sulfur reductase-like enzyme/rhodanese-related sulfurtransferase